MSKVLLVDDDDTIVRAVARSLARSSHDVTCASSASVAIEAIEQGRFDVIVSDIMMPGLSGIDLLREVRKRDLDVPVILMTGAPMVEPAMGAVELGAFMYLRKPFDVGEPRASVERAAQMHKLAIAKRQALPDESFCD